MENIRVPTRESQMAQAQRIILHPSAFMPVTPMSNSTKPTPDSARGMFLLDRARTRDEIDPKNHRRRYWERMLE